MTALALSSDEVGLVFGRLNECQRRWVAGLLADMLGRGGTKVVAQATGMTPKTVRQGRIDLANRLADYPHDGRARRPGAGRPPIEKKRPTSSSN